MSSTDGEAKVQFSQIAVLQKKIEEFQIENRNIRNSEREAKEQLVNDKCFYQTEIQRLKKELEALQDELRFFQDKSKDISRQYAVLQKKHTATEEKLALAENEILAMPFLPSRKETSFISNLSRC